MHNALKGSKDSENNVLVQGEESGKEKANRPTSVCTLSLYSKKSTFKSCEECSQQTAGFLLLAPAFSHEREQMTCQMMRAAWHSTSCAFTIESPHHLCKQKVSC
jgi:hypothetical protein